MKLGGRFRRKRLVALLKVDLRKIGKEESRITPHAPRFLRDRALRVPISNCIPGNAPFPSPSRKRECQGEPEGSVIRGRLKKKSPSKFLSSTDFQCKQGIFLFLTFFPASPNSRPMRARNFCPFPPISRKRPRSSHRDSWTCGSGSRASRRERTANSVRRGHQCRRR